MYHFRLERVLRHRARLVDTASLKVAQAEVEVRLAQQALQSAQDELLASLEAGAQERQGQLDTESMRRLVAWHEELQVRIDVLNPDVVRAQGLLKEAQQELQTAWQDREVLERLKERQRDEWLQEQARSEQRALDEIGAIRSALDTQEDFSGTPAKMA